MFDSASLNDTEPSVAPIANHANGDAKLDKYVKICLNCGNVWSSRKNAYSLTTVCPSFTVDTATCG